MSYHQLPTLPGLKSGSPSQQWAVPWKSFMLLPGMPWKAGDVFSSFFHCILPVSETLGFSISVVWLPLEVEKGWKVVNLMQAVGKLASCTSNCWFDNWLLVHGLWMDIFRTQQTRKNTALGLNNKSHHTSSRFKLASYRFSEGHARTATKIRPAWCSKTFACSPARSLWYVQPKLWRQNRLLPDSRWGTEQLILGINVWAKVGLPCRFDGSWKWTVG